MTPLDPPAPSHGPQVEAAGLFPAVEHLQLYSDLLDRLDDEEGTGTGSDVGTGGLPRGGGGIRNSRARERAEEDEGDEEGGDKASEEWGETDAEEEGGWPYAAEWPSPEEVSLLAHGGPNPGAAAASGASAAASAAGASAVAGAAAAGQRKLSETISQVRGLWQGRLCPCATTPHPARHTRSTCNSGGGL